MRIRIEPTGPPSEEPITPAQLEAIARIVPGDEEAALWPGYISAARQQVERDTDRILIATPCLVTVAFDAEPWVWPVEPMPVNRGLRLPMSAHVLAVQTATGRYRLVHGNVLVDPPVRSTDRLEFEMTLGWDDAAMLASMDPSLSFAVGLLAAHYATTGRDLAVIGTITNDMPMGYAAAIRPFQVESLA